MIKLNLVKPRFFGRTPGIFAFKSVVFLSIVLSGLPAWGQSHSGQNSQLRFDASASIDWARGELSAQVDFDLAQAGIRLPAGRYLGEETLREAYPALIRPFLLSLRVDSNSTIRNLVDSGEVSLEALDTLCLDAEKVPPSLSPDLTRMTGRYRISTEKISAFLTRHSRPVEPEHPLFPVPAADYTGIIIIADEQLPVHGRRAKALMEPCLFPKIWDTNMNLVYERNMISSNIMVRYAVRENIFRPTPSGLEGDLAAFAGPNPLRIIAREVFGINPTDPVIDREDALRILSTENNRRLLREGRVVLVLNARGLVSNL